MGHGVFLRSVSGRGAGFAQGLRVLACCVHQVIDIVARNDEASAKLCELGLQLEVAPNAAYAQKLPMLLARCCGDFIRLANFGVLHLPGNAKLGAQVVGANQQHVNAWHGCNRFGIGNPLWGFQHHNHQSVIVQAGVVVCQGNGLVAQSRIGPHHRAMAHRWKFASGNDGARLVGGVHMRNDHALCAPIQNAAHVAGKVARHAHQWRDAMAQCGHTNGGGGVMRDGAVLHVHINGVEATGSGHGGNVRGARLAQAHAKHQALVVQGLLCQVLVAGLHVVITPL